MKALTKYTTSYDGILNYPKYLFRKIAYLYRALIIEQELKMSELVSGKARAKTWEDGSRVYTLITM